MNMNSLDELMGTKGDGSKGGQGIKVGKKVKGNPLLKELLPLVYFTVGLIACIVIAYYTLFNEMKDYYYKNLTTGLDEANAKLEVIKGNIYSISNIESEDSNLREYINQRRQELSEANLVRTPLEQSFYFTAYFDSLIDKYSIDLKNIKVKADLPDENLGMTFASLDMIAGKNINLLPIEVEFEGTYENVNKLFKDLYTKRIVYDENVEIVNKFDGTVNAKMVIKFTKDNLGGMEGEQVNPEQEGIQDGSQEGLPAEQQGVPQEQPEQVTDDGTQN